MVLFAKEIEYYSIWHLKRLIMENNKIQISVIVPCYKTERYLEKCVNSIQASSFNDYEIILVDDGSPDNTGDLADTLAQRDNRIKVIHQQNSGVIKARETGVNAALGEWITFVDSDDSITPNALEDMYKASLENDTDIIIGFPLSDKFPDVPNNYNIEQYRLDVVSVSRIPVSPWGRLIRRSIVSPFMFDVPREVRVGEDLLFNIRCAFATDKNPVILKTYVYDYNVNEGSITQTFKRTPEYEQKFHELRLKSIHKDKMDLYMKSMISDRLHPVKWWSFHNPFDTNWMESEFVTNLKKDIQAYSYPLSFKDNIMLRNKNKLVRLVLISSFRIIDIIGRL